MDYKNYDNVGMRLINKGRLKFFRIVFSRVGLFSLLIIAQIFLMLTFMTWLNQLAPTYYGISIVIYIAVTIYLINSTIEPTAKLTWLIIIMLAPVFGCIMLIYTKNDVGNGSVKSRLEKIKRQTGNILVQDEVVAEKLKEEASEAYALSRYIKRGGAFPVYDNTQVKYFPQGEDNFKEIMNQIRKAEKFIFMEYFIIDEGVMWGKILEVLAEKAAQGVDVRVLYDGTCEFTTLPHDYPKRLKKLGIKCRMFSPVTPFVSTHYNYRDHRKIMVIDGHTAFTGGVNIADEYINVVEKHGHWKDAAIMLKGKAAESFTLMFLQLWNLDEKAPEFAKFIGCSKTYESEGYVIPFSDSPLDNEKTGKMVYIDILNKAKNYVYIMSPYLILDSEMETAIKFAAERGVDVRIIIPAIPDKKMPFALAKTHFRSLLHSGVRLYEYTPGFIHSKVFVSDDIKGVVGTINLDYRSFYHHFECAAYLYDVPCIADMKSDFDQTIKKCSPITEENVKKEKLSWVIWGKILKAVAPLL